jgi:signal transduction histidine kinase/CheY-like chemotaxis protein
MAPSAPDAGSSLPIIAPHLLVATCSPEGERLHANDAWYEVFGRGALWGGLPPEDARFAEEYVREAAGGGLVTGQVFLVEGAEADLPTPVLLHFLPVHLSGRRAGAFPVVVSGERLQEPQRWAADQTRRRRMEALGHMALGVSHDFNNLLTAILGHAELLGAALEDEPARAAQAGALREQVRTIAQAAADGGALVRKIQQYIRHEKADSFEQVDLATLAREVLSLTRPYWHNEPRRQGILIDLDDGIEPVPPIEGNPTELREVMVNLVLNAVQAMPEGGTLGVATGSDADRVTITVGDTGVGMSAEVRSRIFEPLFTTKGERGSGMGLAVSQGIVQEHGGLIDAHSEPGVGTRFELTFPLFDGIADGEIERPLKPEPAARATGRLLVVDDEETVRNVTQKLLEIKGYDVLAVPGGAEALLVAEREAAAATPFDAVVTDLSMPGMSGRELAAELRRRGLTPCIVLLTGDTDADDAAEHVDAVVKKPFKLDGLDETIQRLLQPDA